jgi:hypothetical protein
MVEELSKASVTRDLAQVDFWEGSFLCLSW